MRKRFKRRVATTGALLAATAGMLCVLPAGAAWAACTPGKGFYTELAPRSNTFLLVSAELGRDFPQPGLLRARTFSVTVGGPWERFGFICVKSNDIYAIQSKANKKYVSVLLDTWKPSRYGMLTATAASVGLKEQFKVTFGSGLLVGPGMTLRSEANQLYVSAELGYGRSSDSFGMLRARNASVGSWEQFKTINRWPWF
jgi:hypothetical protein